MSRGHDVALVNYLCASVRNATNERGNAKWKEREDTLSGFQKSEKFLDEAQNLPGFPVL